MTPIRIAQSGALLLTLSACHSPIQHGLEERDANELTGVLVARGYDARKVPEKGKKPTWAIEVEDDHATDAMRVLTELKLPRHKALTTQDVVAQAGLIETAAAERLRQLEAQEGDLEQALETMDGVTSAAVELVVPPPPRPGAQLLPSKAAVLLRAQPEAHERLWQQRSELRALVAASVDGLKAEDVVLVVDEVSSRIPVVAAPPEVTLRPLVLVLGVTVSALAVMLVVLSRRLQVKVKSAEPTSPAAPPPQPPAAPRPVVSAAVQRKAA